MISYDDYLEWRNAWDDAVDLAKARHKILIDQEVREEMAHLSREIREKIEAEEAEGVLRGDIMRRLFGASQPTWDTFRDRIGLRRARPGRRPARREEA